MRKLKNLNIIKYIIFKNKYLIKTLRFFNFIINLDMQKLIGFFLVSFSIIVASLILISSDAKVNNSFSAYYNTNGAFAGFIQRKNNKFRACEFSSNGSVLSCSKWFEDDLLKQGQNEGLTEEFIRYSF
tara:strand:+ start:24 stop:407 length:384 start_codon:yes stop_codon:yes gene_type:complete